MLKGIVGSPLVGQGGCSSPPQVPSISSASGVLIGSAIGTVIRSTAGLKFGSTECLRPDASVNTTLLLASGSTQRYTTTNEPPGRMPTVRFFGDESVGSNVRSPTSVTSSGSVTVASTVLAFSGFSWQSRCVVVKYGSTAMTCNLEPAGKVL